MFVRCLIPLLLMAICLSGCFNTNLVGHMVGIIPVIENDDFAIVHVARPTDFISCGIFMNIQLNNKDFFMLACREQISFRVPANKTITISQTASSIPDYIDIYPEKGKEYYFENDCNHYACWLHQVSKDDFFKDAERCVKYIKLGFPDKR